jgi:hypothetical protein
VDYSSEAVLEVVAHKVVVLVEDYSSEAVLEVG